MPVVLVYIYRMKGRSGYRRRSAADSVSEGMNFYQMEGKEKLRIDVGVFVFDQNNTTSITV